MKTSELTTGIVTVLLAIAGIATVAALVSKNSNTTGVINSSGNAFVNALNCALSPITGKPCASSSNTGLSNILTSVDSSIIGYSPY